MYSLYTIPKDDKGKKKEISTSQTLISLTIENK